jgi:Tfp pilus assembly protein PilX
MAGKIDYVSFSDECRRLAEKQGNSRDRKRLMRMAEAWLLVAELDQLHQQNVTNDNGNSD